MFNVIGPGEPSSTVCGSIVSQLIQNRKVRLGNLFPKRDFLDVRDVASALSIVGDKGKSLNTYNICSGDAISIEKLLDMIIKQFNKEVNIEIDSEIANRTEIAKIVGNNQQLLKLGWKQSYSLENSLKDLIRYYTKQIKN